MTKIPLQRLLGALNYFVLRHLWMRISWQEDDRGRMSAFELRTGLHPRAWYR
jgi:hypothetical protein